MLLHIGTTLLDRYVIEEYIGEGGMQEVFRAQDQHFLRPVALKVPKNASAARRFAQSAQVSARIVHTNVAKTLDYFEVDGRGHLVEEFIAGRDLSKLLRDDYEYLDPHLAAHVFHLMVKGVAASHHAGVIHRDLKPNNVMIGGEPGFNIVKLTDFGIAKMAEEEITEAAEGGEASMSQSSTAMGALPYMAPELIESSRNAGKPVDIWSLGAILYRLCTGKYPFGSGWGAMKKILSGHIPKKPAVHAGNPQFTVLSDRLWEVTQLCLQLQSANRPSADALLEICAGICYSDARRRLGHIKSYKTGKAAIGFIKADDDGETVMFHLDSYYGQNPMPSVRVNFACFPGQPRDRAFPVLPMRAEI
jgi:serine/threonine protein kinase